MLYESRFTFPFSWLVGKRLEGMGELHFTTEKKIREHLLKSFQDLPHAVWMKPPWNGRGRVYCFVFQFLMCFFISYYLFLGAADKNLTIIFTNTNISRNHMSGDILGGNRSQLSPLSAQYMHKNELFQNWTPTR